MLIVKVVFGISGVLFILFQCFFHFSHGVMMGFYPYVVATAIFSGIGWLLLACFPQMAEIVLPILGVLTCFFIFSCFQVWRYASQKFKVHRKRRDYLAQAMDFIGKETGQRVEEALNTGGLHRLLEQHNGFPVTSGNTVQVLDSGTKTIDEIIEAINRAKHHIHIAFFILRHDNIGSKLKEALIRKAQEGVEVRLLYDAMGSVTLKKKYIRELKAAGIQVKEWDPLWKSLLKGTLNHRNHRKIVVVDGVMGIVGGLNIGDEYLSRDKKVGCWADLQVKVQGEAVKSLQGVFLADWYGITGEKVLHQAYFPQSKDFQGTAVQMVSSGFEHSWSEMSLLYFSMITSAKKSLYIATPYLILNDHTSKAIQTAALKGVRVKIVVPYKPDLFIVGWANHSFFQELLDAKVEIYQYQGGFLHAKVLLVDQQVVSIGSANLNNRSMYLDQEVNAVIYDPKVGEEIEGLFQHYLEASIPVEVPPGGFPLGKRIQDILGKLIIPFA